MTTPITTHTPNPTHLLCIESFAGNLRTPTDYREELIECRSLEVAREMMATRVYEENAAGRFAVCIIRSLAGATKRDGDWFDAPALPLFPAPLRCVKGFPPPKILTCAQALQNGEVILEAEAKTLGEALWLCRQKAIDRMGPAALSLTYKAK